MLRTILALAILMMAGCATDVQANTDEEVSVRITARRLDDGRTEFALQQYKDGEWGDRVLPRIRMFPKSPSVNRWLVSSPITIEMPSVLPVATPEPTDRITGWGWTQPCVPNLSEYHPVEVTQCPDNSGLLSYCDPEVDEPLYSMWVQRYWMPQSTQSVSMQTCLLPGATIDFSDALTLKRHNWNDLTIHLKEGALLKGWVYAFLNKEPRQVDGNVVCTTAAGCFAREGYYTTGRSYASIRTSLRELQELYGLRNGENTVYVAFSMHHVKEVCDGYQEQTGYLCPWYDTSLFYTQEGTVFRTYIRELPDDLVMLELPLRVLLAN